MSDKVNLISALSKMQKELKVPKEQINSFSKYKFRSCEDILEAVKKVLPDNIALVIEDEIVQIGDRFYVKATATIGNTDGQKLSCSALAREAISKKGFDESQITGATSSYARKYALSGLFLIDDAKDADTRDNRQDEELGIRSEFRTLLVKYNIPKETIKAWCDWGKVDAIEELSNVHMQALIAKMKEKENV